MFEAAGAKFNDETGFYEMHGLTDLTELDMINAYAYYDNICMSGADGLSHIYDYAQHVRTFFARKEIFRPANMNYAFRMCSSLEVLRFAYGDSSILIRESFAGCFMFCKKLHTIVDVIEFFQNYLTKGGDSAFTHCYALKNVKLYHVNANVSFAQSPLLTLESFTYLVDNATNKSAITITVHPDIYAKLTDPNNAEWSGLMAKATAKQIQFASA